MLRTPTASVKPLKSSRTHLWKSVRLSTLNLLTRTTQTRHKMLKLKRSPRRKKRRKKKTKRRTKRRRSEILIRV